MTDTTPSMPSPGELRRIAGRVAALADTLTSVTDRCRAAGPTDAARGVAYRLHEVISTLRGEVTAGIQATADDLTRIGSAPGCAAEWGLCPDHGQTLRDSGNTSRCVAAGCGRTWPYHRAGNPCDERPAFHVIDEHGTSLVCAGHAEHFRAHRIPGQLVPLTFPTD